MKIRSISVVALSIVSLQSFADLSDDESCAANRLALLDQHLVTANTLLRIREELLNKFPNDQKVYDIIDHKVDPVLFGSLVTIGEKDNFSNEYKNDTAQKLYKKDAKQAMREFCRYRPKNLEFYQVVLNPLVNDCKTLECNYCDLSH